MIFLKWINKDNYEVVSLKKIKKNLCFHFELYF